MAFREDFDTLIRLIYKSEGQKEAVIGAEAVSASVDKVGVKSRNLNNDFAALQRGFRANETAAKALAPAVDKVTDSTTKAAKSIGFKVNALDMLVGRFVLYAQAAMYAKMIADEFTKTIEASTEAVRKAEAGFGPLTTATDNQKAALDRLNTAQGEYMKADLIGKLGAEAYSHDMAAKAADRHATALMKLQRWYTEQTSLPVPTLEELTHTGLYSDANAGWMGIAGAATGGSTAISPYKKVPDYFLKAVENDLKGLGHTPTMEEVNSAIDMEDRIYNPGLDSSTLQGISRYFGAQTNWGNAISSWADLQHRNDTNKKLPPFIDRSTQPKQRYSFPESFGHWGTLGYLPHNMFGGIQGRIWDTEMFGTSFTRAIGLPEDFADAGWLPHGRNLSGGSAAQSIVGRLGGYLSAQNMAGHVFGGVLRGSVPAVEHDAMLRQLGAMAGTRGGGWGDEDLYGGAGGSISGYAAQLAGDNNAAQRRLARNRRYRQNAYGAAGAYASGGFGAAASFGLDLIAPGLGSIGLPLVSKLFGGIFGGHKHRDIGTTPSNPLYVRDSLLSERIAQVLNILLPQAAQQQSLGITDTFRQIRGQNAPVMRSAMGVSR